MAGKKFKKSLFGGVLLGLAAILILTSPALAVDTTKWTGSPGSLGNDWIVPGNWDNGVPDQGYDVIIDLPEAYVYYPSAADSPHNSSNPTLKSLLLDPSDPQAEVSLEQVQDVLTVKNTTIGSNGTASYFLDTGINKVLQDLTLGFNENGEGYYYIDKGTLSVGGHETLGLAGAGYLFQSPLSSSMASGRSPSIECTPPVTPPPTAGPTHSVGKNLYLGFGSGSEGEILLTNSSLTVGGSNRVGIQGKGLFEQTNSIVKIKGNYYPNPHPQVGEGALSYSPDFSALSKKNLKNNQLECVSSWGPGLIVGLENVGSYNLSGGSLNVDNSEIIGLDDGGNGAFAQTNGTHTINGNLFLGKEMGSLGTFNLSFADPQTGLTGLGLLDIHGFASVGYLGDGSFSQTGGTVKIWGIDQEVNLRGKSLSTTLSKGASLSCSQHQYIGFTVGRGGTGVYYLDDGELSVSQGEIIGMLSGSNGQFEQIGGKHFIGGNLTIARDQGSNGSYLLGNPPDYNGVSVPTPIGVQLKVQGSLLNNQGGTFDYYGGELLANIINKGTFNAYGSGTRAFPKQFFNYGTFEIKGNPLGTAAFAQKFQNYGVYKSSGNTGVDSRFTSLYIAAQGYIDAESSDNYYVTKEFTNNSKQNTKWNTYSDSMKAGANLIFTGPGRKPFKTGSTDNGVNGFTNNFAWGSLGIEGNGSVQLLGHLYADQLRGVQFNTQTNKITNLFGYCGGQIYYHSSDVDLSGKILTNIYGRQVGYFTGAGYVPDCK